MLRNNAADSCWVEVKSVTLSRETGLAEFPDSVTVRGAKHLDELAIMAQNGDRAVMLFLMQRDDCDRFAVAGDIDPHYAARFEAAKAAGVEVLVYQCDMSPSEIAVNGRVAF